jgi:hypothetical protein
LFAKVGGDFYTYTYPKILTILPLEGEISATKSPKDILDSEEEALLARKKTLFYQVRSHTICKAAIP